MFAASKPRGATAFRGEKQLPHKRLLAAGCLCLSVALILTLLPKRPATQDAVRPSDTAAAPEPVTAAPPGPVEPPATSAASSDIEVAATREAEQPQPQPWHEFSVKRGDNLSLIFKRAGYGDRDLYRVVTGAADGKSLARIYPGQTVSFRADETGELAELKHVISRLETVAYQNSETGWTSQRHVRTPEARAARASGVITSSLYMAGEEAGLSQNLIMEMANIFGGVIDFVLDPRKGDTMHVLYEELYLDDEKFRDGRIVAASFTNRGKTFNAYRYEDAAGNSNFYSEDGVSMRKAFLLAPVDFSRVSSNFNLRRLHPIYKTTRPHRGTDYAAPRGTPVYAAGDGRVVKAGYSRANGNYVFIQHGEKYMTRYLHLHKRRVSSGSRVSQGQVIGTVGSTGAATGPHLHYEFLVNGVPRNPRTIHKQLPKAKSLPEAEMPSFLAAISGMTTQLAAMQSSQSLALLDDANADGNSN
jgi:murein DD-endopeptidase MepM/ murein hydrolase activator NlpD